MSVFLDRLTDQLNLRWAWEKVRRASTPGDVWFDEVELAGFELELELNLQRIASEFRKGTYHLKSLRLLPYPKQNDKEGNARVRQMFYICVRDQVAWTAVVNLVGPYVDSKMPPWSYGHRLYRSIWVEEDKDGIKRRKIGRYRHSSGRLYLPFGQSWPIFRRHVYLTTRAMIPGGQVRDKDLDEKTREELTLQESLQGDYRCPFVLESYWQSRRPAGSERRLYWCSVDLERFYPTLKTALIRNNIVNQLPPEWQHDADRLLNSMLHFPIDPTPWDPDSLAKMGLGPNRRTFSHIPTGLYVAGFLANAGLLSVDVEVARRLRERAIAHLRFVDDHIILAYSMDDLTGWVHEYNELLSKFRTGARINHEKVEPKDLARLIFGGKGERAENKLQTLREHAAT